MASRESKGPKDNSQYEEIKKSIDSHAHADLKAAKQIESVVRPLDGGMIRFEFRLPEPLRYKALVLIDESDAIVSERPAVEEEICGGYAVFDFRKVIEDLVIYTGEYCTPALRCENPEGEPVLVCFTDAEKAAAMASARGNKKKAGAFMYSRTLLDLPRDYNKVNIKKLLIRAEETDTYDPETRAGYRDVLKGIDMDREQQPVLLWPTMYSETWHNMIRVVPVPESMSVLPLSVPGVFKGYHFDSRGFTVRAFLPGWKAEDVVGAELRFSSRTEEDIIPAEYEAHDRDGGCMAILKFRFGEKPELHPLKWECGFKVRYGDKDHFLQIRFETRLIRYTLKIRNVQSRLSNGYILYPYLGLRGILKLMYREESGYDTVGVRAKEIIAMAINYLGRPFFRKNKPYIVYEKFSKTAQDNSYYFFKYCMEELPREEKNRFWYVMDKKAPDYQYVKQFEPRVIQFMSIKHMLYAMNARLLISTDASPHLYAWQTKPSFVYSRVRKKPVYFLQHGVTAMKRVDDLFGINGANPMKYFVATSETEQRIIVEEFGYDKEHAPIVGFTRWDALEDKTDPKDRFILLMPTWRAWLEDVSDEAFMESDYYRNYYDLLTGKRLRDLLDREDMRLVMYLHPKFARYIDAFRKQMSDNIELVAFGTKPLNEIMMRASMLITDYSSVCWDMLYMDKPVIYYQFDLDTYLQAHGSYIDLRTELPGPRVTESEELLNEIDELIQRDFIISDNYEKMIGKYFKYRDRKNCERTYQFLKENE